MALFRHLAWFFKDNWRTYLIALVMLTLVAVLSLTIPWLIGRSIDTLMNHTGNGLTAEHYQTLFFLLVLGVTIYLLRVAWRWILFGTSYRLGNLLRSRFYIRLTHQGQRFFSSHNTGDLMARATNDIDAVELAAGEGVLSGFDGLLTFVLVLVMMFALIDWRLAALALLPFPLMGIAFYRISNAIHHQFREALERFSALNDKTQEALSGIALVKAMGLEASESATFNQLAEGAARSNYKVARSEALYDPVIFICLTMAVLLTLGCGGWLIARNELTVGELTTFTLYLGQLIWPMFAFGWLLNIIERGSAAFKRVDEMLIKPDEIVDQGTATVSDLSLEARALSFTYPGGHEATLDDISFNLPSGQVLGIAGPTGAGKTTLIQLIMRYRESAETDQLLLGDQPLSAYPLQELRRCFAYVPQEPFLFSMSIADNIALARPDASREEIEAAARTAAIHEDILRFKQGYETPVGERGMTLSGGQRQRLAIARALLSGAPLLILDDALSAVDVETEQQIIAHLQQRQRHQSDQNPTSKSSAIIISHRLSALEHADEILVLTQGHVSERGSHSELIRQDGWYARMWVYQKLEATLDA
ncbi:ABC transporter transmembrane domain-containing protein [Nitrincola alkalilacustris]|uniref:ABC transporter transmembrane domain-containing protein n=1 Tax=Nitrincola alkalilacustris TaxID=1571224 RepID=UPI00124EDEEF|nr:ABC transporter transmembrane domain-containing protein [Nitrincola alkalilacustris]